MPVAAQNTKPVIVFDVNETLLDLTTLKPLFERLFGSGEVLREWFPEMILYSQTMTLSGKYTAFGNLAGGVLRMVGENHGVEVSDGDVDELKGLVVSMPAYDDVKPGLKKLKDAGFSLVTLTNSTPTPSPTPLEKAGIADFFDHTFSVDAVEKYKPHPATYELVARACGVGVGDLCMVACHIWDTIGAQAAGTNGAFLKRPHNSVLKIEDAPQPDIIARDMGDLADRLIAAY
jgi:2-haloacid dehalogenase